MAEITLIWRVLILCSACFLIGGLPVPSWVTRILTGKRLSKLGTGNVSVSAAFYHGGKPAGILSALSEAGKGIAAVLLARQLFPTMPAWELWGLLALVLGRNLIGGGAGATNTFWGFWVHDWVMNLIFVSGGWVSFHLVRNRKRSQLIILALMPIVVALLSRDGSRVIAMMMLSGFLAWTFLRKPDDLEMSATQGKSDKMLRWMQRDRKPLSLNQQLDTPQVGQKAATLAQLKQWGYAVPDGWVLPVNGDAKALMAQIQCSPEQPVVVRSSAVGEDSEEASAAGQYESILHVISQGALGDAISTCLSSYNSEGAQQYRQDRQLTETAMAVLVQQQVQGVVSGVAFSRDPIACQGSAVIIEALPGDATQVVSGQVTPEQYRVEIQDRDWSDIDSDQLPAMTEQVVLGMEGSGEVSTQIIQQVAVLARHLESRYHGIPQDLEWSFDGKTLWLLQARPITTLLPIWTRKIAAEVIPGVIRPLTWSVNQPLTCGVWGQIFSIVLGDRAQDLDFGQTATLHHGYAYFNASLLGEIFRRMGLPPESLEFLTRGAKFSKPPIRSTLINIPGLLRLVQRERQLLQDFQDDNTDRFQPALKNFQQEPTEMLSAEQLLSRVEQLLALLEQATYYSILAPLGFAARQALFKVQDSDLNNDSSPEVTSLQDIRSLAAVTPKVAATDQNSLFAALATSTEGQSVLTQLEQLIDRYGYLSEVGTDIAVPTWKEDPSPVRELFTQFCLSPPTAPQKTVTSSNWKTKQVQKRLDLKGQVTSVYSQLLAHLRWCFVALEDQWRQSGVLTDTGDIFYLELNEVQQCVAQTIAPERVAERIHQRKQNFHQISPQAPFLLYGKNPPMPLTPTKISAAKMMQGIGVSAGQVEGPVKVLLNFKAGVTNLDPATILVVPYTDSGWAPLLARAAGLIADVGGRLSHGAIVAREYGIPAVMDINQATQQLQDGQIVRIDGQRGTVELVDGP
ncbi:Prodigiosin synthesizing transferase PigC [Acaryochloris thomasi RCC1774]|uniref:Prodigiosin synthesizing transferase PigC n=1 Tax=Acaryochloris thomasi RCC1774 TaxID=1764569 RepID=A0A2W1JL06_9CYAN|nr:glycerol-3-phosphate acyltransferase [Acaryochloris thomasi]PZD74070.1 Prodigiosin synthesizing transferase PigC [Acaryochloris thomasi RCC1774]